MKKFLSKFSTPNDQGDGHGHGHAALAAGGQQEQQHFVRQQVGGQSGGQGKRTVGYFANWGIYTPKYFPTSIPLQHLTHVNYAFANVEKETGRVVLGDGWSDVEIHYEGDTWNDEGNNLYGNFKAFYKLKERNRNLKILLSIGGWSYRGNFSCLVEERKRREFVRSGVGLVEDLGIDGLDIDWEYPANPTEARAFVDLLAALRQGLDDLAEGKGRERGRYELTVASPGSTEAEKWLLPEMDRYLDFWNIMTYDYSGTWDNATNHCSNLYPTRPDGYSADSAVRYYLSRGIPAEKIVLGMTTVGVGFNGTGGIGQPFQGPAPGTYEAGRTDYRLLPQGGAQVYEDLQQGWAYAYDQSNGTLTSYDSLNVALLKAQYINNLNLGGAMFWQLDADHRPGEGRENESIVIGVANNMQGGLLRRENELSYPGSSYANLRNGTI